MTPLREELARSARDARALNEHVPSSGGTRDHYVKRTSMHWRRHIRGSPPRASSISGVGPVETGDVCSLAPAIGLDARRRSRLAREHSGCEVWEHDFLLNFPMATSAASRHASLSSAVHGCRGCERLHVRSSPTVCFSLEPPVNNDDGSSRTIWAYHDLESGAPFCTSVVLEWGPTIGHRLALERSPGGKVAHRDGD